MKCNNQPAVNSSFIADCCEEASKAIRRPNKLSLFMHLNQMRSLLLLQPFAHIFQVVQSKNGTASAFFNYFIEWTNRRFMLMCHDTNYYIYYWLHHDSVEIFPLCFNGATCLIQCICMLHAAFMMAKHLNCYLMMWHYAFCSCNSIKLGKQVTKFLIAFQPIARRMMMSGCDWLRKVSTTHHRGYGYGWQHNESIIYWRLL